jgi:glycosyltransferase involved in cell wall biosynthesis
MAEAQQPNARVAVLIPALNEAASIGAVVQRLRAAGLARIIVADNGSRDATAQIAANAGARVVSEPRRGYGAACLAAIATLEPDIDIVAFTDADGADVVEDLPSMIARIASGEVDMVVASRALGHAEPGAMTPPQRFGNWLASALVSASWRVKMTDLGPMRAIRRSALDGLAMADRDFGWTVEMQVKAARAGLRYREIPTDYRRRAGISKISGTITGVVRAGAKILWVIAREAWRDARARGQTQSRRQ